MSSHSHICQYFVCASSQGSGKTAQACLSLNCMSLQCVQCTKMSYYWPIYTRHQKLSTTYIFLWNNFQTTLKKFHLTWKIFLFCETLHWYLNENKKNTCDIWILFQNHEFSWLIKLLAMALKFSRISPTTFWNNFCTFFTQYFRHLFMCTTLQWKKVTLMCFLVNWQPHNLAKNQDCFTILSLCIYNYL